MIETALAKINLALHVRARRTGGYHELETLFAFLADGDLIAAEPAAGLSLTIDGPFADGLSLDDNLVLRAAQAFQATTGYEGGAALRLTKNLPVASGIGGGSADAAATLRLLCRLWEVAPAQGVLHELAAELGADVPACLASETAFGRGRGDALFPARSGFEGAPVLLVNPLTPLATGPVFAGWDGRDRGPLDPAQPEAWRNDLVDSATALVPAVGTILEHLADCRGVIMARMSGSGATCFALFDSFDARDAAAGAFPDCWTLASSLR